jgi:hypothetical protein
LQQAAVNLKQSDEAIEANNLNQDPDPLQLCPISIPDCWKTKQTRAPARARTKTQPHSNGNAGIGNPRAHLLGLGFTLGEDGGVCGRLDWPCLVDLNLRGDGRGAAAAGAGEAEVPVRGWDGAGAPGVGAGRGAARAGASEAGAGAGEAGVPAARLGRGQGARGGASRGAERRIRWGRELKKGEDED